MKEKQNAEVSKGEVQSYQTKTANIKNQSSKPY
jgi:hypothetical protein